MHVFLEVLCLGLGALGLLAIGTFFPLLFNQAFS